MCWILLAEMFFHWCCDHAPYVGAMRWSLARCLVSTDDPGPTVRTVQDDLFAVEAFFQETPCVTYHRTAAAVHMHIACAKL